MSKQSLISLKNVFPAVADDFFTPWSEWFQRNNIFNQDTVPALNVSDEKDEYIVTVAAPGLEKSDFDIRVNENVLTISATSEKENEGNEKNYRRREYSYSTFSRTITLPPDVNKEGIEGKYDKGILTLHLPKNENGKTGTGKTIQVS